MRVLGVCDVGFWVRVGCFSSNVGFLSATVIFWLFLTIGNKDSEDAIIGVYPGALTLLTASLLTAPFYHVLWGRRHDRSS